MSDPNAAPIPPSPYGPASESATDTGVTDPAVTDTAAPEYTAPEHAAPEYAAPEYAAPRPAAPAPEAGWVARGRGVLRVSALVAGALSVLLTITLVVLAALGMGTANNDLSGINESVTFGLIFAAPVLFVIALNLLIWRALLRPLGRLGIGGRIALIILMVLVLGLVSIALVVVLLFAGFFAGTIGSVGSGF